LESGFGVPGSIDCKESDGHFLALGFEDGTALLGLELGCDEGIELGTILGVEDGTTLGLLLGLELGSDEGAELGTLLGWKDGSKLHVGSMLGFNDGILLGSELGMDVGSILGCNDGKRLGFELSVSDGTEDGGNGICVPPPQIQQANFEFLPFDHTLLTLSQKLSDKSAHL
jgi:hypothetical protein